MFNRGTSSSAGVLDNNEEEDISQLIADLLIEHEKIVLFTRHHRVTDKMQELLEDTSIKECLDLEYIYHIDGRIPEEERQ
ncbi:unnamed protein product, partial [Amoebophrya sp. A25]|eukprot:GSA25T00019493001.1